jgi:hypothetical protein
MTTLIKQIEAAPTSYPTTATYPGQAYNDVAWQRVESYIASRYTARDVTWTVEGPGEWVPPLKPATISSVEIWAADAWEDVTPDASPLGGFCLTGCGPYRFTGTVGGGSPAPTVPSIVWEAVKRLAGYLASKPGTAGATSESLSAGSIAIATRRSESWMAQALQNSGAADLLRGYRRA